MKKLSLEHRRKLSESHKGNKHSEETRKKISNSNIGRYVSIITKLKIKESIQRKKDDGWINHNLETRKKMSSSAKGRNFSKEVINKRKDSRKGYSHTKETKDKIATSNKGKTRTQDFKLKMSNICKKRWLNKDDYLRSDKNKQRQSIMLKSGFAAYMCSKVKSPSKPQIQLFNICKNLFPTSILQYQIGNYCVDIAILDRKIVIEYDCWYWHQDVNKDLNRQKEIEKLGWKFIRFRDYLPSEEQLYNEVLNVQDIL